MATSTYFDQLLENQNLPDSTLNALRDLRDQIEGQLRADSYGPTRVYYGGSFGKKTMIRESYDLDIVAYWKSDTSLTLKQIFDRAGWTLKKHWKYVHPKTVAWTLPFQGGFHIDVVPGRAIDASFYEANLYRNDNGSSLKTSIKKHIDTVRNSGRQEVIRLMKLWRLRNKVPWHKTLALELMTIDGASGTSKTNLEEQLNHVFSYIRNNIANVRIVDPANKNNIVSDEISQTDRSEIWTAANNAVNATNWVNVLGT